VYTPLTAPRQFDILQSRPGWRGPNEIRSTTSARVHHASRRRSGGVTARGAHAAVEVAAGSVKMDKDYLVLKRASVSRSSGEWSDAK
jgi:hypothetical protein